MKHYEDPTAPFFPLNPSPRKAGVNVNALDSAHIYHTASSAVECCIPQISGNIVNSFIVEYAIRAGKV